MCQFVTNFLSYVSAKHYLNWFTVGKVVTKIKRVNSLLRQSVVMNEMIQWNEWKCSDLKCIQKPTRSRLSLIHLPVQPMSRVKSLDGPRVRVISPVVKEKVYGGKDLLKSQVLISEWNTERVIREVASDSEDGEDDEQNCHVW